MATLMRTEQWDPEDHQAVEAVQMMLAARRVILRQNARRPANKISPLQQKAMNSLGKTSRYFREKLTPAEKLQWGTKGDTLTARDGLTTRKWGMTRWTQVQMPLDYTGHDLETTNWHRDQTQIRNLEIIDYNIELNAVQLGWEWRRGGTKIERFCMHVSQVPQEYLQRENLWRYARHCDHFHQYLALTLDIWYTMQRWFWLNFLIFPGNLLQLYVRINHFKNLDPPITKQESTLSVEDWWTLITHIT